MTSAPQDPYPTRPYPQPGVGAPGAPPIGPAAPAGAYPVYGYPYPARQGTNTMAILALVFAFVCAPAAIVMGTVARRQIRRTGEEGWGMATAGLVCGIVFTVLSVIWVVAAITIFAAIARHVPQVQHTGAGALARARFGW